MDEFTNVESLPTTGSSTDGAHHWGRRRGVVLGGGITVALAAALCLPGIGHAGSAVPDTAPVTTALTRTAPLPSTLVAGRPGNGAVMTKRGAGSGEFTADNTTNRSDAVVTLSRDNRAVLVMYVRAGASATATKIPDGTFDVFTEQGQNWDSAGSRFGIVDSSGEFDRKAEFATRRTGSGSTYTTVTITLHTVADGNARVLPVPATSIPR